ncbi:hypothetical protein CF319_g6750 [Tilletia indica]|nr:hypothetical protein CF319_g6750 [Tilletia indica]
MVDAFDMDALLSSQPISEPPSSQPAPPQSATSLPQDGLEDEDSSGVGTQQASKKRSLASAQDEDEEAETARLLNQLPPAIAIWVKEIGLDVNNIINLINFGEDYEDSEDKVCPGHIYRSYGQQLLLYQLVSKTLSSNQKLEEEIGPELKKFRSVLIRVDQNVNDIKDKQEKEGELSDSEISAINKVVAHVFFSADVQGYSKDSAMCKVISLYLERNPAIIGTAFATHYNSGDIKYQSAVTAAIKKKVTNLRSHSRDLMHWSLGIDEGKKKLNLYELFTKLTQSYQVPLTKERILRVAYLRSIAAKSNPRVVNGGPKSDWWSTVDASVEKMLKQFTGNQPGCSKLQSTVELVNV